MKKLILTLALAVIFASLLAFSAFAKESDEFGTPELIEGMSERSAFGADGTAQGFTTRVVLFDGVEYHTYPSYYLFSNTTSNPSLSFDALNAATGKEYSKASLIRIEVPKNIVRIGSVLRDSKSLVYIYLPETIVQMGQDGFHGCSALKYINVPRDCTEIAPYCLNGCGSLEELDMTEAVSLKKIRSHNLGGSKITSLVFPEGFESFDGISSSSLKVIKFPNSVTSVGVLQCSGLEEIVFPANLTTMGNKTLDYCGSLKRVTLPKSLTSIVLGNNPTFFGSTLSNLKEIYYTGKPTDPIVADLKTAVPNAQIIFINHCDVYYNGEHIEDGNPCVINCEQCGAVNEPEKNPVHETVTKIEYASYALSGSKNVTCMNEGCAFLDATETSALFDCLGYSVQEGEMGGLVLGFKINKGAISDLEEINGVTISYGVFAATKKGLGDGDVIDNSGNLSDKALGQNLTKHANALMQIKVTGFTTDEQRGIELALGAFVIVKNDEGTAVSYLFGTEPNEGETYAFVTLNRIDG